MRNFVGQLLCLLLGIVLFMMILSVAAHGATPRAASANTAGFQPMAIPTNPPVAKMVSLPCSPMFDVEESTDLKAWTASPASAKTVITATNDAPQKFYRLVLKPQTVIWHGTLTWLKSPDASVTGYCLYLGPNSHGYTQRIVTTNTTVQTALPWIPTYASVTTLSSVAGESDFSDEARLMP